MHPDYGLAPLRIVNPDGGRELGSVAGAPGSHNMPLATKVV